MIFSRIIILFSLILIGFQPLSAQSKRRRLADLPPFERAVVCIRYFEGMHGKKDYPYVGYGHQLLPGEHFTAAMTERQADSLLRADLWKCFEHSRAMAKMHYCLLCLPTMWALVVLLGYGNHPKSRLIRKIESGDRNYYREFVSFCRYKGKVLRGLVKRRKVEFALFYIP